MQDNSVILQVHLDAYVSEASRKYYIKLLSGEYIQTLSLTEK